MINSGRGWEACNSMASNNRTVFSPPKISPLSPAVSAVRASTPRSGPLSTPMTTPPPFNSSPALSSTQRSSSPDYFEDFVYTSDMDEDFRRIDLVAKAVLSQSGRQHPSQKPPDSPSPPSQSSLNTPPPLRKIWVVFRGRIPGIYDDWYAPLSGTK